MKESAIPLQLTPIQQEALEKFRTFLADNQLRVFILKGYAGTGKTTLTKNFIAEVLRRNLIPILMASTGRAAKILANITQSDTSTVHSRIYAYAGFNTHIERIVQDRQEKKAEADGQLVLQFGLLSAPSQSNTRIYFIDEASMVCDTIDKNPTQAKFGSGRLLADLLLHDSEGKFVFIGDTCQLPPIMSTYSPALTPSYFREVFHLNAIACELTQVMRQAENSGIIRAATDLRRLYFNPQPWKWAKFPLSGHADIRLLSSNQELYQQYVDTTRKVGFNHSTLIVYSNKQSLLATQSLRPAFGHSTQQLEIGDLLIVTQNNLLTGLMNGDLVKVTQCRYAERRAGLSFLLVEVEELFTKNVYSQLLIEDILSSSSPNLTADQQRELFIDFYLRMKEKGIKQDTKEFNKNMLTDPYLNALRTSYGYALTCHKAQGGEWTHVFLDLPRHFASLPKPYVYQWLYTAITRARTTLYLVNDFWIA